MTGAALAVAVLPLAVQAQSNYATPYTFTTLAGAAGITGTTNGLGSVARFFQPSSVAVDASGVVYIAETNNHTIRKLTVVPGNPALGDVATFAGLPGVSGSSTNNGTGAAVRFNSPHGVAVDRNGNVYVADTSNHAIRLITPAGVVSTYAGGIAGSQDGVGLAARFISPWGVAVDGNGNVYVADSGNNSIRKIAPGAVVTNFAGGLSPVIFGSTDGLGGAARFGSPRGVAVDANGTVYVADRDNNLIRSITPAGLVSTVAGFSNGITGSVDGVGTAARFNSPYSVTVDGTGTVYIADASNATLRKMTPAGVVTTLAGLTSFVGTADGTGSTARFDFPQGIAVTTSGTLYVADTINHTIRLGVLSSATVAAKIPGITIPLLVPPGATAVEGRAFGEQLGGGVLVAISSAYAVRPGSGSGSQALAAPNFTNPQPYNLSYVVRLLGNGQPDPSFTSAPGADGTVNAFIVQPDGKIVTAGTFAKFNGTVSKNLARLKADGTGDATFNVGSGFDAQVNALALQSNGAIVVGGLFQTAQGLARPYLARMSASGAIDASFAPTLNGVVNTLALQPDGKILVGGNFTTVGGVARARIARLLSTGAIDPTFDPGAGATGGETIALLLQSDGKIVAAGDFTSFAGQTRGIVRLLPTGAIDPAFLATATADAAVISLGAQTDGKLLLGGAFTKINGVTRNHLARLLADGTLDVNFDPGAGTDQSVRAVLPREDGTVFLGGLFDNYQGSPVNEVVAITATPVATAFLRAPQTITVNVGGTARFVAEATGAGALSYQWFKDGVAIVGATASTLTLPNATADNQGRYVLKVTSTTGSVATSSEATLAVVGGLASQIINLSVLTSLDAPDATFTLGFVIGGTGTSGPKPLLVRAGGPSLSLFGVGNPLADPKLDFFAGSVASGGNDNWGGTTALSALITQVGAFPYTSLTSKDAAFAPANLTTAANSVVVSGVGGATGAVIAEVYDASAAASVTAATPRLLNVSVLKNIPANAALTAGFVVRGNTTKTILIRAIGPTLAGFGVGGPMDDPKLTLYQAGTVLATNDNWNGTDALKAAFTAVGAFALEPTTRDAALLVNLSPGSYTAEVTGVNSTAGSALVEVYEVP